MTQQVTFTASVGGETAGTLSAALTPGKYCLTFSDAEVRVATVAGDGVTTTWTGALNAGSITTAIVGLSDQNKVDVRRHGGYPVYGAIPSSFQSYRFFQAYGVLEYRMGTQANGAWNMLAEEIFTLLTVHLANCATLEAAIPTASSNLDTDAAGPWKHNPNELVDREALYSNWRRKLCRFIGVPMGPDFTGPTNSVALVV